MARTKITEVSTDLVTDSGNVLWSFVKGEFLEFPLNLTFITNPISSAYTFEAVIVEGANDGTGSRPTSVATNPNKTTLALRIPADQNKGTWNSGTTYYFNDLVLYNSKYYTLLITIMSSPTEIPGISPYWLETPLNQVYLIFTESVGDTWAVQPTPEAPVYGFFELRVTEKTRTWNGSPHNRTWKPIRGLVEILFSPTDEVP